MSWVAAGPVWDLRVRAIASYRAVSEILFQDKAFAKVVAPCWSRRLSFRECGYTISETAVVPRNRLGDLPFQPCLQSPCRETLRNRRSRHTPGTRHTRCHRAGIRSGPWGVCRQLPSFSGPGEFTAIPESPCPFRVGEKPPRPDGRGNLIVRAPGGQPLGNRHKCSFRQIVAVFRPIANRFFDESSSLPLGLPPSGPGKRWLERRMKPDVY